MATYRDTVVAKARLAYYRLQETTGTNAVSEITGADGTYSGTYTLDQAGAPTVPLDKAVSVAWNSGKVSRAIPAGFGTIATIEAVVYRAALAERGAWCGVGDPAAPNGVYIGSSDGNGFGEFTAGNLLLVHIPGRLNLNTAVALGTGWKHVVVVINGTAVTCYVNGTQVYSGTFADGLIAPTGNLYGIGHPSANASYGGIVSETAFYNKALTAAEVAENYNAYAGDTTAPTVTATPTGGSYQTTQSVTLTANETATIYYTTDGTTPTTASTVYSAAISIAATTTLKFFAKDTAGNSSAVVTETYTIDASAPTVSLTSPAAGATIKGTSVVVSADAADNVGVASVTFKHGTTTIGVADTTAPYSVNWDTTTVPNGDYSLTATAVDAAGNSTVSAARTVTVKNVVGSKKGSGSSKTLGRTLTVPVNTTVPVGDVMIVSGTADGNSVLTSVTDTKSNVYTVAESRVNAGNTIGHSVALCRIATALVGATDTVTLNFSADTSIRVGVLDSLSGSEGGAVQATADAEGNGTAPDVSITPGTGTPTLVASTGYTGDPAAITYAAGVGFTELSPEVGTAGTAPNRASGSQMLQDATSGAQGSAAVLSAITDWVHITLALSLTVVPVVDTGPKWFVKNPPKFVVVKQPPPRKLPITHTRKR